MKGRFKNKFKERETGESSGGENGVDSWRGESGRARGNKGTVRKENGK